MKKNIIVVLCVACMLPSFVCMAFANEGYAVHPRQALPENIITLLKDIVSGGPELVLLDCDPTAGTVEYVSWVSYDYLSELANKSRTAGVIVYNSTMKAYFIRISFVPTVSTSGSPYEYCALGTTNGFALGAKDPSSGDSTEVTIDTSGIIQRLNEIRQTLSVFSANVSNSLWNIGNTLADFYYYNNLHLEEISTRIQSAGDHLGIIESYLQIYFADMAADIHTTALESTRIRSAAESIEGFASNISTYTAGAYSGVNTIADLIVGWPEKFDQ